MPHPCPHPCPHPRPRRCPRRLPALLALAALCPAVAAQDAPSEAAAADPAPPPAVPEAQRPRFVVQLDAGALYAAETDLDGDDGDVQVWRAGAGVSGTYAVSDALSLRIGFDSERSWYDWGGLSDLIPGAGSEGPLEEASTYSVSAMLLGRVPDTRFGWFAGASLIASFEDGADIGDALYGGFTGGVTYQVNERLRIGAGLSLSTEIEDDDVFIVPFPVVEYRINDRWRVGTEDRGFVLGFTPAEALEFRLLAGFERRQYRLEDDGGAYDDGVFIDSRVPVAFGLTYRPSRRFELSAVAGASVWTEFEILDSEGDEIEEPDVDPGFFAGVEVRVRF